MDSKGYNRSCGVFFSLTRHTDSFILFRTVAPDPSKSLDYYRKACDEGHIAEACHRYSAFFIKGMKGACDKNMQEAFTYSLKGNLKDKDWESLSKSNFSCTMLC